MNVDDKVLVTVKNRTLFGIIILVNYATNTYMVRVQHNKDCNRIYNFHHKDVRKFSFPSKTIKELLTV